MDFLRAISLTFLTVGIFWNFTGAIFLSKIGSVPSNILIILIIGAFTGGYFGAYLSKLKGNMLIKKTFTAVCLFVGTSLLIKSIKSFYIYLLSIHLKKYSHFLLKYKSKKLCHNLNLDFFS